MLLCFLMLTTYATALTQGFGLILLPPPQRLLTMVAFFLLFCLDTSVILFSNMQRAGHSAELMVIHSIECMFWNRECRIIAVEK